MAEEVVLMKGNEAIAHAAIRCGADMWEAVSLAITSIPQSWSWRKETTLPL